MIDLLTYLIKIKALPKRRFVQPRKHNIGGDRRSSQEGGYLVARILPGRLFFFFFIIMQLNIKIKQLIPPLINMLSKPILLYFGCLYATYMETGLNNLSASLVQLVFLLYKDKLESRVCTSVSETHFPVSLSMNGGGSGSAKRSLSFCRRTIRHQNFEKSLSAGTLPQS